jgi:hypothetical protein
VHRENNEILKRAKNYKLLVSKNKHRKVQIINLYIYGSINMGFRFFEGVCGFMLGEWGFSTLANVQNN